jgi:hypothetical protein
MTTNCPKGSTRNKKTGRCNKKTQRKRNNNRCPKGTQRNKKTGNCDHKKVILPIPSPVIPSFPKTECKRCPRGTHRNKETGICGPKNTRLHTPRPVIPSFPKTERKRCPNGTQRNKKTGNCDPKNPRLHTPRPVIPSFPKTERKRCPKGTQRNKKTGNCDPKNQRLHTPRPVIPSFPKTERKRCPKGTQRNKKTGNCDHKEYNLKVINPIPSNSKTPTYKNSISHLMNEYMNQSTSDVFPYVCNSRIRKLMLIHLLETNKTGCSYDIQKFGLIDVGKKIYMKKMNSNNMNSSKDKVITPSFIKHIREQYERCKSMRRLMVMPITIKTKQHANVIIFNPFRNEVERFEPHGTKTHIDGFNDTIVNDEIKKFVDKLNIDATFVPSHKTCPIGYKAYQEYDREQRKKGKMNNISVMDPGGYCCAWSFFYTDLRLKYPRLSGADIIRKSMSIIGTNPKTFRSFIHGQVKYLHKLMKRINKDSNFEKYVNWYNQNDGIKFTAETIRRTDQILFSKMEYEWEKFVDKELIKYL